MRLSTLFGRTLREPPSEAEQVSDQLAQRAGLLRPLASGIYSYLPLGWRVLRRLESIVCQELETVGSQAMYLPLAQPADLLQRAGPTEAPSGGGQLRCRDQAERLWVLGATHQEAVADLLRSEVQSYRQLPLLLHHIGTTCSAEPHGRSAVPRTRERRTLEGYSCSADPAQLEESYERVLQALDRALARCGVRAVATAPTSAGHRSQVRDYIVASEGGDETLLVCSACGYVARQESATSAKPAGPVEAEQPLTEVATPGCETIEALAAFVGVPTRQTLKAVFYTAGNGEVVLAVIRGDLEVNVAKLANLLEGAELLPSSEVELSAAGVVAGYASPVGLPDLRVVADDSVAMANNLVAGANRPGYHLKNVNYPRDFAATVVADIALAKPGHGCPNCQGPLTLERGIAVGNLGQDGTHYSQALGAAFLDKDGRQRPILMASYALHLDRLLAAVIDRNHDERGIVWPAPVAPLSVHLLSLAAALPEVAAAAEEVYTRLLRAGYEVLFDDRDESAGVKFNDADLIGLPWRLTIGRKTLAQGSVELKGRRESTARLVPLSELEATLHEH